jgi:hypothetical protein
MKFTFVCNCGKIEEQKIYLKLKLGKLVKMGSNDFPHTCDGYLNSHFFLKRPLVGNESDLSDLYVLSMESIGYLRREKKNTAFVF